MKTFMMLIGLTIASPSFVNAQRFTRIQNKYSLALTANEVGFDAGVGIEFGTRAFLSEKLRLRFKTNMNWLECYKAVYDHWAKYNTLNASLVYNIANIERSLVYAELGMLVLFPDSKFSDVKHSQGLNGLVGVDMFVIDREYIKLSYFFSGGVMLTTAHAEKLEGSPRYGNGFLFSNGFRIYF